MAAVLSLQAASADVPASVVNAAIEAVTRITAGQAAAGLTNAEVERWKAEVERLARLAPKITIDPQVLLETKNQLKASVANQDAAKASVAYNEAELAVAEARAPQLRLSRLEALPLAKGARISIRDKAAPLTDLKPGMHVSIRLTTVGDRLVIAGIAARD